MTWRAGVDALSFGGTKNGLMGVEAVVLFDPALGWEFELRRKRAAHLFSKHRYLAAQMLAYLEDDLWLRSARAPTPRSPASSPGCGRAGLRGRLGAAGEPRLPPPAPLRPPAPPRGRRALLPLGRGARRRPEDEPILARLVCDWSTPAAAIDSFVASPPHRPRDSRRRDQENRPMAVISEPKLISGNANIPLAKAVARRMSLHRGVGVELVKARVERFNDQEIFVEVFENVRGEDMFIIQRTSKPANDTLMELLIITDALRRSSAAASRR